MRAPDVSARVVLFDLNAMLKKFIRQQSVTRLLTSTVTLAITCLALSTAILTSAQTRIRLSAYFTEQGVQITETLANQSRLAAMYAFSENGKEAMANALGNPGVVQVRITDVSGNIIANELKQGEQDPAMPLLVKEGTTSATLLSETSDYWAFVAPIYQPAARKEEDPFLAERESTKPQLLGYAYVIVAKSALFNLVASVVLANSFITVAIAALMLLAVYFLMRQVAKPLNELSRLMTTSRSASKFMRAEIDGPKDVLEMAKAYNEMMDTLDVRETELRQSRDEALRTAMLKSQFAAMVSHEIRTPLNGIIGMLEVTRLESLPRKARSYIEVAWQSAKNLGTFTTDVLDISKVEAGKLQLEEREFDIHELVDDVLTLFSKQAQKKGVELAYVISPTVPDRIRADNLRLRQVLNNLVGNAVKFTDTGKISVKVSGIVRPANRYLLTFDVCDTGIGIPEADLAKIFQPYEQARTAAQATTIGTGLGLALCKQLVTLMHGTISVESQPGTGTTFRFTVQCEEATQLIGTGASTKFKGKRALIVEENEVVRDFLVTSLARLAIQCSANSTGAGALDTMRDADRSLQGYDLVILNSGATDDTGGDLERRIRQENFARRPSLLLLDLHAAPFSTSAYEGSIVLGKPLSQARVISAVEQLLHPADQRHQAAAPAVSEALPTILVVDDNRTNQMVVNAMLSREGYAVRLAKHGEEAVDACRSENFALILMDCLMPVMDGYEATTRIRMMEADKAHRTPIVAITANQQAGQAERCAAAGMDDFLTKPISFAELREKLQRWAPISRPADTAQLLDNQPPSSDDEGPVDLAVYNRLQDMLGANFPQMCHEFLEDLHSYVKQLQSAVQQGNSNAIGSAAHAIRGSASNLGAIQIVRIIRMIEDDLGSHLEADLNAHISALQEAVVEIAKILPREPMGCTPPPLPRAMPQILVVDDDRSTRTAIRCELQQEGFEIAEAANGLDALQYLKEHRPDAILMDALMPEMDGFVTCSKIQLMPDLRDVPIIMITSLDDGSSIDRAFAAGACDYLTKPIHFTVLSQRVRRIIRGAHAERRAKDLVTYDPITNLPNRASFLQILEEKVAAAEQTAGNLAVFLLNVDRFKTINETWGHEIGDKLLREISTRLSTEGFDHVGRLGGDEFAMLKIGSADPTSTAIATQKLCASLSTPFKVDEHDIHVDVSVGVSLCPTDAHDSHALLKGADLAMQRAKRQRTSFQFYNPTMDALISESAQMELDLKLALERDQLQIYYQPQVSVDTGRIAGAEALLRWHHPTRGVLYPAEFMPDAEKSGIIVTIGNWVLHSVCRQIAAWKQSGLDLPRVSVNVSRTQILHPSFMDVLSATLQDSRCEPNWIQLEVAEDLFHEHPTVNSSVLASLRALGVHLCIDDFGTGSRPLSYIKPLPITTVKVDRSFVQDLPPEDANDLEIVSNIINFARALNIEVIADGVETPEQEQILRNVDCVVMQGFLFSQAVPADSFPSVHDRLVMYSSTNMEGEA